MRAATDVHASLQVTRSHRASARGGCPLLGRSVHYHVRVSYITRAPSQRLAGIVERLWRVEDNHPTRAPEAICPDGRAEIIIHLGDAMEAQPRHLLVGQMETPIMVTATGRVKMLGARFTPTGLHRVLPMSQDRLVGQIVPLDSVWDAWTRCTVDQVAGAGDAQRELRVFEHAIELLVPDLTEPSSDRGVELAVRAMRTHGQPLPADRLAKAAGVSRRQFERRFREHVGLGPNLFGRIVRFQHAFAALGHEPGAMLAARLGYVDQAHLIHEVRRFSGRTPTLLAEAEGLTTFFANATS